MWKKNWVFPIKIHITFVILSICIYVQIQMQQLDIATDKKHELPDVTFVSTTYIGLNSREKGSFRDLLTNSSSYTRDSFLEIRQKWKKNNLPRHVVINMFFMVGDSNLTKINRIGLRGSTMQADNIDWTDGTKIRIVAVEGHDKKKVNENKKVLVISCSSSIKRFQSHCN